MPTAEKCPKCGGILYRKKGKNYLMCKENACDYRRDVEPTEDTAENGAE